MSYDDDEIKDDGFAPDEEGAFDPLSADDFDDTLLDEDLAGDLVADDEDTEDEFSSDDENMY